MSPSLDALACALLLGLALPLVGCSDSTPLLDFDNDGIPDEDDCDPSDACVYPGADEVCDGKDNDCDDEIDEGFTDLDGDGYPTCSGDCDDLDETVYPGAEELCDGKNNDCAEGLPDDENDVDGDGWMACEGDCDDQNNTLTLTDTDGDGHTTCDDPPDCDDEAPGVFPGAPELCDAMDNDCDGMVPIDEFDSDGDGTLGCEGDCDDEDASLNIDDADGDGASTCDDPPDCDDWNPALDLGDLDGDGYTTCDTPPDCDDGDPSAYPGGEEAACDYADNDCDGELHPQEVDDDGDGFDECQGDCDDSDPFVHPAAEEICNGIDDDCDGTLLPSEADYDGDGWTLCEEDCDDGDPALNLDDADGDGYTTCDLLPDCDDSEASVYPGAPDVRCSGVDEDCDGVVEWMVSPGDSIQSAIDGSDAGDLVCVAEGTYYGPIVFPAWPLHLLGYERMDHTVLDADENGPVVTFENAEGPDSILEGFTITHGLASHGGGVLVSGSYQQSSSPTLAHLAITGNTATDSGGGLALVYSNSNVDDVTVTDNLAAYGGGMYLEHCFSELHNLLIAGNAATLDGSVGDGGGVKDTYSFVNYTNVIVAGNEAGNRGGGMYFETTLPTLANVTIVGNATTVGDGGGIFVTVSGATITNTTLTGNTAALGVGLGGGIFVLSAALYVSDSNAHDNVPNAYCEGDCDQVDQWAMLGQLAVEPGFIETSWDPWTWDLHIWSTSELRDAGDPAALFYDPDGSPNDIGAYGGPFAGSWDLDNDGYDEWWQPGTYDHATYPGQGWDCDDSDPDVYPGSGC